MRSRDTVTYSLVFLLIFSIFSGIYVPEKDGGTGLTRLDASLIFEEFGKLHCMVLFFF